MNTDASPKRGRPPGQAIYPRQLSFAVSASMYDDVEKRTHVVGDVPDRSKGDVARELMAAGRDLIDALGSVDDLAERVEALRAESGVSRAQALGTLLDFATKEARRRQRRDRELATRLAQSMADDGIPFDGLAVGSVDIAVEG